MLLKRLELVGFKSFAQKTVLDFPGGITGIVGPNGSGKSNLIDGLRWLLGERDAKNIRGAKAEDLIFAGTPQKPRLGMAQATIVFDNATNFFPVDFEEVAITRKVTRDGVSQYFLNEAETRMKDIIDFFAKARLGTKGFTIINQGSSDLFVRADAKERRTMIEEILGLRQYQLKKHEAERKMQNTRINMDKVRAMLEELAPRLRLLRRQTAKWEKHDELKIQLADFESRYFGHKLFESVADSAKIDPQIAELESRAKDKQKELSRLQVELQKVEAGQPRGDKSVENFKKRQGELLRERANLQKEIGRLEAQIEFLLNRPKTEAAASELVGALKKIKELLLQGSIKEAIAVVDDFLGGAEKEIEKRSKELESAKSRQSAELQRIDGELEKLAEEEKSFASNLQEFNAAFRGAFEAVEAKKMEINALENSKNKLFFEKERVNIRRGELERLAAQGGRFLKEFQLREHTEGPVDEVEKKIFRLRGEIAGIGEVDELLIKEAKEAEERDNFLSGQIGDLEKASGNLEALIRDLDEKIHTEFTNSLKAINDQFNQHFQSMFGGGRAKLILRKDERPKAEGEELEGGGGEVIEEANEEEDDFSHKFDHGGIDIELAIPRKRISGLEMLSGGEKSLVSIAVLFALVSVSPPPFLVLDEVDAALDERNSKRFATLIQDFSKKTQFIIVTHNRSTMESASVLYGVTMKDDGTSKVLSVKLE